MKTFKEFQEILEGYKEPNIERMKKQADKFSRTSERMRSAYEKDEPAHKSDLERIYKRKKETTDYDTWQGKNKAYYRDSSGKVDRGQHSGDLLSVQNRRKYELRNYVEKPERKARNIRAKIQQHQNDPLGYMSKTFGGPHFDYGMDMKRRPKKKKVEEAYKEPNIERMKKQAARHQSKADYSRGLHTLDTERKNIYKGKKNTDYGSNSPKGYYRSNYAKGEVRRGVDVNDLESINRFEKRQHKQNVEKPERRASNIRAKVKQHSNDPLGYMSKAFGGPHIDTGMDIKRRPKRKKVQEGYKEPNLEKMEKKAARHQFDADYKKDTYSMDDIKRNIYKGKRNRERDPNTPMYFRSPYLKGKPSRRVDANDLESVTRFEKRRHKQEIEPHERRASNIRAKVSQYKQDPLGYMSKSFGGPTIHPEGWKEGKKRKK